MPQPETPLLVETIRADLHEVTDENFSNSVQNMLITSMPGFVVRAAHSGSQFETAQILADTLANISGVEHSVVVNNEVNVAKLRDPGIGPLHDDYCRSLVSPGTYTVHETTQGIGRVTVANSGPAYVKNDPQKQQAAAELLKDGLTDPEIMDYHTFSAIVASGDKVISPIANRKGPVWHRYDTLMGPRRARAMLVVPRYL